jgi:hypothetical protein
MMSGIQCWFLSVYMFFAFQVSTFGEATMGDFNDDTEYLIRQSDNYFKPSR